MAKVTKEDRAETQRFVILNTMMEFVGQRNYPDVVDKIVEALMKEIQEGPCAWAFSEEEPDA